GPPPPQLCTLSLHDALPIYPGEGVEIVVDQRLAGDGDHPAIGLDLVALLALAERPALELSAFTHLQQLGRFAELHPVHRLEVGRSEEHTSELQSRENLVCRL